MSEPEDPARLFESADAPAGLRDALRTAREDVGSPDDVQRLAARLGPLLGPVPTPPSPSGGSASAALKWGFGALALLVVAGAAWLLSAPPRRPLPPAASARATPPVPLEPRPDAPPAESAPAPSVVAPPPERPQPRAQLSEAELLERARAALKSGDAARALQRANEHAARFPRGVLVQEREVLAIQALRRLGRTAEADRRAEAFAKAYPGSAFQRKLER